MRLPDLKDGEHAPEDNEITEKTLFEGLERGLERGEGWRWPDVSTSSTHGATS